MYSKGKIRNFRTDEDFETIRSNLLKTRDRYTDLKFSMYTIGKDKDYGTPFDICDRPFFIKGHPSRFDALQGGSSDCWVVSAIEALTSNYDLLNHVVPSDQGFGQNYAGIFHFRFWDLGTWVDVVVDDRLPVLKENTRKLYYTHSKSGNVFWAALLEKAYAKFCSGVHYAGSYDTLNLGNPMNPLQDFSGGIVEWVSLKQPPPGTSMKWFLEQVYNRFALMTCHFTDGQPLLGLYPNHTYTVTKLVRFPDKDKSYPGVYIIRVMNPWGNSEWRGIWNDDDWETWKQIDEDTRNHLNLKREEDGEAWMDQRDFIRYFERVFICHLGPGQYLLTHAIKAQGSDLSWSTTSFRGEWVKHISAGGESCPTRHMNPQYEFWVQKQRTDTRVDEKIKYTVILELVQKFKLGLKMKPAIGIYIYHMESENKSKPLPLNDSFFKMYSPMVKPIQYQGRSYVTTMDLVPGRYLLVPHCLKRDDEAQFLLRVFSLSSAVTVKEPPMFLSKSMPTEEQEHIASDFDGRMLKLFDDKVQGRDELDWIDLQDILDVAMNNKRPCSGIVSFFTSVCEVFRTYLSLDGSSETDETGDVVFTKDECRSLIAMSDDDHSGKMSYSEFINLWNKIMFWTRVFEQNKDGTNQYLTTAQMRDALSAIGYNVDKRTAHSLSYIYADEERKMFLTDFILCGVTLETALSLSQQLNLEDKPELVFTLEEWVKNTLFL